MRVVQLSTVGLTHSTNGQKTALFSFADMYRAQLTGILSYQLFSFPDLTAKVTVYLCYSYFLLLTQHFLVHHIFLSSVCSRQVKGLHFISTSK